jgi:hypothetical protein
MWIMLAMGSLWIYARPGGTIRGKWRIPDEKVEWSIFMFRAPKVVAPACVY